MLPCPLSVLPRSELPMHLKCNSGKQKLLKWKLKEGEKAKKKNKNKTLRIFCRKFSAVTYTEYAKCSLNAVKVDNCIAFRGI